jgi:hypothetical protein
MEAGIAAYKSGNYPLAMSLWRPLAVAGNPQAQNNVGVLYEKGQGVPIDLDAARQWYQRAARQGHVGAQKNLADLGVVRESISCHVDDPYPTGHISDPERLLSECFAALPPAANLDKETIVSLYLARARAYLALDRYFPASVDYSEILKQYPDLSFVLYLRSYAQFKLNHPADALKDYDAAEAGFAASSTNAPDVMSRLSVSLRRIPELEAAMPEIRRKGLLELASRGELVFPGNAQSQSDNLQLQQTAVAQDVATHQIGNRVALVIGNSNYTHNGMLPNADNDAELIAAKLRSVGFRIVRQYTDLDQIQMRSALKEFMTVAQSADWAVIYYAGHGIEVSGTNYIIPTDANINTLNKVAFEAVPLNLVIEATSGARNLRMVIADACREDPFTAVLRAENPSRSVGRGLARVEPPAGVLVAFAARDGQLAQDGNGRNSPFAIALAKHLSEPGVEIGLLFRRIRDDVLGATGGQQEPFVYGSLSAEELYFVGPPGMQR